MLQPTSRPVQPPSGQRQASTDPISCETCRSYGFALTRLVSYKLLAPITMEPFCSIEDKPRLRSTQGIRYTTRKMFIVQTSPPSSPRVSFLCFSFPKLTGQPLAAWTGRQEHTEYAEDARTCVFVATTTDTVSIFRSEVSIFRIRASDVCFRSALRGPQGLGTNHTRSNHSW